MKKVGQKWQVKKSFLKSQEICLKKKNQLEHKFSVTFLTKVGTITFIGLLTFSAQISQFCDFVIFNVKMLRKIY